MIRHEMESVEKELTQTGFRDESRLEVGSPIDQLRLLDQHEFFDFDRFDPIPNPNLTPDLHLFPQQPKQLVALYVFLDNIFLFIKGGDSNRQWIAFFIPRHRNDKTLDFEIRLVFLVCHILLFDYRNHSRKEKPSDLSIRAIAERETQISSMIYLLQNPLSNPP